MNTEKLSEDFLNKIIQFAAGFIHPAILESFFLNLGREIKNHFFTYRSESNLLRIISAMYDKRAFISDSVKYPHYLETLVNISVNSNYLTDILVRNPEYFYRIVNPSHLNKSFTTEDYRKLIRGTIDNYKTFNAKVNALRTLKKRETLRIGLKDISKISGTEEITLELSILAKELSAGLFETCYSEILEKNKLEKVKNSYCIISLGKLGGKELNYSSDIDLMIFYDKNSVYNKKEYREVLTEAVFLFIDQASAITGSGYLYRVDFRLRPDGRNAPLCGSITDYMNYYESRGEDWERQMLIKADYLAGDKSLFYKFIKYLQPFIYPSSFKISPIEQIRKLKINIERSLKDEHNIKLAWGGIRDIEFTVQALQLINGYQTESLRTGNTLTALKALSSAALISSSEFETLSESYIIYRKIEHYLQLMNDLQTHSIPSGGETLSGLSSFLGFKNENDFVNDLRNKRKKIREIFDSLTGPVKKTRTEELDIKFFNKSKGEKDLDYLREGKGLLGTREFDLQSINAFSLIEPELVRYLSHALYPDLVLQNFVRVIRTSQFPSVWYNSFQNKKLFTSFLTVCEYCQRGVDLFAEDIHLQELFLSGGIFKMVKDLKVYTSREFHFLLSVQLCLGILKPERFSTLLSEYYTQRIILLAHETLADENYLIAGMGSFGAGEMTFASDIDLIFCVDGLSHSTDQQKIFQKFLKRLKEEFHPMETDCRLRPEGKSSQLVWDIKYYLDYLTSRARVWELQALTKLNYICGSKAIFNKLSNGVKRRLESEDCSHIVREISEMRKKLYPSDYAGIAKVFNIKKSPGSLTDIEFIIQSFILCTPELFSKCRGQKISKVLRLLQNKLPEQNRTMLLTSYNFFLTVGITNQNIFNVNSYNIPLGDIKLSNNLGFNSPEVFSAELQQASRRIRELFLKYLDK